MRKQHTNILLSLVLLMFLSTVSVIAKANSFNEYALKAGFIYKFISFVDWPIDPATNSTITIGILGDNPFGDAFKAAEGNIINERTVLIKYFNSNDSYDALKQCQVLYIAASENKKIKIILQAVENHSVMTISDCKGFIDAGGIIGFVEKKKKKISFEINDAAAKKVNLRIRSMLKRIAQRIILAPDNKNKQE